MNIFLNEVDIIKAKSLFISLILLCIVMLSVSATFAADDNADAVAIDEITDISEAAKLFPDYETLPNVVDKLKIRALPATFFLNTETKEIKPLVQGMVTLSDLKRRSIDAGVKYAWLKPEDYKLVKPFEEVTSLSGVLNDPKLASKITEYKEKTNPYGEDTNFVSPDVLVKEIVKAKEAQIPKNYVPRGY